MDESILNSIKDFLGINPEDTGFDQEIIMHVNSSMSTLYQIGVDFGDAKRIVNSDTVWSDLFSDYDNSIDLIKLYVSTKVKVSFDPPSSSFVLNAMNEQIQELEWRIFIEAGGDFDAIR